MKQRIKKIFRNHRVIILMIVLLFSLVSISPNPWAKGVSIRTVTSNSSANIAGIKNPKAGTQPMAREVIFSVNNRPVRDVAEYYDILSTFEPNRTVQIRTDKGTYMLRTREQVQEIDLNETETIMVTEPHFDEALNRTINVSRNITRNKVLINRTGKAEDIGLNVYQAPTTNIRKGLDLQGGTRILLQPETELDTDQTDLLISNMRERLNVYGLSDINIRSAEDLFGKQYIVVEIAGATEQEVRDLLAKQGKFEAKIGNSTVFLGGDDIKHVCRSSDCSGLDPMRPCGQSGDQWFCNFRFSISLSREAAERQAEATKDLEVVTSESGQNYLSEKLSLYLDDTLVNELSISPGLKGQATTDIQISGSGTGLTQQDAVQNSLADMKKLQTVLSTGSLPVKLDIVKMDRISAALGEEFVKNAIFIGIVALIVISISILIRYRRIEIVAPIVLTLTSEIIILLGFASLIRWNLDLAAIAGMIITMGTAVDHLIVISDETLGGEAAQSYDWKVRIKNAFFIIMGSYLTTTVAMIWLWPAGAGLLKGFAFTTIAGASIGVFIARPAYAAMLEILVKE